MFDRMHAQDPAQFPLAEAAAMPLRAPQRRWLLLLPAAAMALDAVGGFLPYALLAATTVVFVIASWTVTLRSAARCLLAAASGARTRAERDGQDVPPGLVGRLIALWLLAMMPASAVLTGASPGVLPGLVAFAALAVLTPATLVLTRTVSLPDALDPLNWRDLVTEIGAGSAMKLAGVLFALAVGYLLLAALPLPDALEWLGKGVLLCYWIWATLAWFELGGRVLHGPEVPAESDDRPPEQVEVLFERVIASGGTRDEHRRLADALVMADDRARLLEHGRVHVNALLAGFEQPRAAVEEAGALLDRDPLFALGDTESMYRLVRAARRYAYPALTIRLCGNYLDAFPRSFKRDEVRLIACEAAAAGGRDERRMTADWLGELVTARLADDQRARLKRIVPIFHAEGLIRRSADRS
jgi:hypothetical protein